MPLSQACLSRSVQDVFQCDATSARGRSEQALLLMRATTAWLQLFFVGRLQSNTLPAGSLPATSLLSGLRNVYEKGLSLLLLAYVPVWMLDAGWRL